MNTVSLPPPSFDGHTYDFGAASTRYPMPHGAWGWRAVANNDCWLMFGDSAVVAVAKAHGAVYIPADTILFASARPENPKVTHFALIREGTGNGWVNVAFLSEYQGAA